MQSTFTNRPGWPSHPIAGADLVWQSVTNSSTYTVPAGKVLCLAGVYFNANAGNLQADGTVVMGHNNGSQVSIVVTDQHRNVYNGSQYITITSGNGTTPTSSANLGGTGFSIVNAPWLHQFAAGTVLAMSSATAANVFGFLIPANAA